MHVGIIGAGAAASTAAHVLDDTGIEVTILERSDAVGGRAATRQRGAVTYDCGTNYLKTDDERVLELVTGSEGLERIDGPLYVFDAEGTVTPGRDETEEKLTYRGGMTELSTRLLGDTAATVHRNTRVTGLERTDGRWRLTDATGDEWGPFDAVVCTPPAPQTATLLRAADWDSPVRAELVAAVESVSHRPVWTGVLGYEFDVDLPYYALVNPEKSHDIDWLAREECKPGHVPDGQSVWLVQANSDWSATHAADPPAENIEQLAATTAAIVGDERLADPDWSDHQHWPHALPEGGPSREPLRRAEAAGLYCAGDWVSGEARFHAALRDGLETGDRLLDRAR